MKLINAKDKRLKDFAQSAITINMFRAASILILYFWLIISYKYANVSTNNTYEIFKYLIFAAILILSCIINLEHTPKKEYAMLIIKKDVNMYYKFKKTNRVLNIILAITIIATIYLTYFLYKQGDEKLMFLYNVLLSGGLAVALISFYKEWAAIKLILHKE